MLQELEHMASAAPGQQSSSESDAVGETIEQVETLRATVSAQKQAQRLLALATKMRNEASTEGERILQEAKGTAARLREEASTRAASAQAELEAWVVERRTAIETVVSELIDSASREAEDIRSDALQSAMTDAEARARVYTLRAEARADRDAEELRDKARAVLDRAIGVVVDAQTTMRGFADSMASQMIMLTREADLTRAMLDELSEDIHEAEPDSALDNVSDDEHSDEDVDEDSDEDSETATPDSQGGNADKEQPASQPKDRGDGPAKPEPRRARPGMTPRIPNQPGPGRPLGSLFGDRDDD